MRWRPPRLVFVCSMSDLFHDDVPDEFIDIVLATCSVARDHTFQILTKRPARMREYFAERTLGDAYTTVMHEAETERAWNPTVLDNVRAHVTFDGNIESELGGTGYLPKSWPLPNVWLGASCEDQTRADERLPHLIRCPAAVRFVSAEPLLGPIDFRAVPRTDDAYLRQKGERGVMRDDAEPDDYTYWAKRDAINWVIVGGESGPKARECRIEWIRDIVSQCASAGVPCFVKQLGSHVTEIRKRLTLQHPKGGDMSEWPEELRVRQWPKPLSVTVKGKA